MNEVRVRQSMQRAVAAGVVAGMVLATHEQWASQCIMAVGCSTRRPRPEPMHADTLFDLASLTKVLCTTTLVMRLVESGDMALDSTLHALCPQRFSGAVGDLTPRLVLLHAAGFPAHIPFYREYDPEPTSPEHQRETVLRRARTVELAYRPGTESRYSDLGMIVLGDLIEQLRGVEIDKIFDAEVANPLSLRNTFLRHLDRPVTRAARSPGDFAATERCSWRDTLVRGVVHDENAYLLRGAAGHAGLFSTAADVLRLASVLLAALHGESDYLQADTVHEFTRRQDLPRGSERALGWSTRVPGASCGSHFSPLAFGHTGFTGTSIWIDPEPRRIIVLLANRVHPSRDNTAFLRYRPRLHDIIAAASGWC